MDPQKGKAPVHHKGKSSSPRPNELFTIQSHYFQRKEINTKGDEDEGTRHLCLQGKRKSYKVERILNYLYAFEQKRTFLIKVHQLNLLLKLDYVVAWPHRTNSLAHALVAVEYRSINRIIQ